MSQWLTPQGITNFYYETSLWNVLTHTLTETHSEVRETQNLPQTMVSLWPVLCRGIWNTVWVFNKHCEYSVFQLYYIISFCAKMFLYYGKQLIMENCFGSSLWEYLLFNSHGASRIPNDLSLSPPEESGRCLEVGSQPAPDGSTDLRLTTLICVSTCSFCLGDWSKGEVRFKT